LGLQLPQLLLTLLLLLLLALLLLADWLLIEPERGYTRVRVAPAAVHLGASWCTAAVEAVSRLLLWRSSSSSSSNMACCCL
jgi:hypothetical protein